MNILLKIKQFSALSLMAGLLLPLPSQAGHVELSDQPLVNMGTSDVLPNVMFVLDNSGSMGNTHTPDWANTGNVTLFRNSDYNTQFYNPAISYIPAVTHAGVTMGNQGSPWTEVKNDVTDTGAEKGGKANLVGNANYYSFVAGEYCTAADLGNCITSNVATATHPFPAPMRWCNSATAATAAVVAGLPPNADSCRSVREGAYTNLRRPSYTSTFTVSGGGSTSVTGITVNGRQILSAATNSSTNASTVASRIVTAINACTTTLSGNCTTIGYSASIGATTSTVRIISFWGSADATFTPMLTKAGTMAIAPPLFVSRTPGRMTFTNIVPATTSYVAPGLTTKAPDRTDCAGTVCNYAEEMTNYANWHTYYRTRMQAMKTATSLAFKGIDSRYRVGFITITGSDYLAINKFTTGATSHKQAWYQRLYSINPSGVTPLRNALARVGRIYAGKEAGYQDPVEYACQQNFTLLTTDGYWNGDDAALIRDINGNVIGNLDGGVSTPKTVYEGPIATSSTLADVSKYYYDTDIRAPGFANCTGALGNDVCGTTDDHPKQSMTTLTLGLGIDGTLLYADNYKDQTSGDFANLRAGVANWPVPVNNTATAIDDLWHAAVNGNGTYYSAKNPKVLRESLVKGLSEINSIFGAGSAAASSSLAPTTVDNFQYVASYRTVKWTGNLEARAVDIETLTTSRGASWCVENVASQSCTPPAVLEANPNGGFYCKTTSSDADNCSALSGVLGAGGTADACYVTVENACDGRLQLQVAAGSRKIYVNQSGALTEFSASSIGSTNTIEFVNGFNNLSQYVDFTTAQQTDSDSNKVSKLVDYLKGNKLYENRTSNPTPANKLFRAREATLGDITQSRPAYFKKSILEYTDPGYEAYKAFGDGRQGAVFAGANDGMLHAFNANNGDEMWAFIPSPVIKNMPKLADRDYGIKHKNFVNGSPLITDICVGGCTSGSASWRSILVAGLNGGGRGYYAIDVTNPASPTLLWEFTDPNMGYSFGNPIVTKLGPSAGANAGKWVVVVTSGYNNGTYDNDGTTTNSPAGNGQGYLYVLDAYTGTALKTISTGVGSALSPSGLARIAGYASNPFKNNLATHIYGGDLEGNVWRFDINLGTSHRLATLTSPSSGTPQPITTMPELGTVNNKRVVLVGTGKYLEASDITDTQVHSVYAIKDDDSFTTIAARDVLVPQTLSSAGDTRSMTAAPVNFSTGMGWMVDFPAGERVNLDPLLLNGVLLMPTLVPNSSSCLGGGYGWFNYFNYKTGGSPIPGTNFVSEKMNTPAVGFNVMYKDGKPSVSVVGSNDPTPKAIQQKDVAAKTGASNRTTVLKDNPDGTYGRRSIWRELLK